MGKFCQFMTELSVFHMSVFSFTKLGMCTDMEIWVGIANGQSVSTSDRVICPPQDNSWVLSFPIFIKTY